MDCIIPFYNESKHIDYVVNQLLLIPSLQRIVLVDDGSTDGGYNRVLNKVQIFKSSHNEGKSTAVKRGLHHSHSQNVLLFDADFQCIEPNEIKKKITEFEKNSLDMLILQVSGGNNFIDRLLLKEILFSGARIIRTRDLRNIYEQNPENYQLEVVINQYMRLQHKKVCWARSTIKNVHKIHKWGLLHGLIKSIKMELSILNKIGLWEFRKQIQWATGLPTCPVGSRH